MTAPDKPETGPVFSWLRHLLDRPWPTKSKSLYSRWTQHFPGIPLPIRLPCGAWWLARNDAMGALLTSTGFENSERQFVDRFLRPGMTVIDVGAHHGYYTLLASKRVGKRGRVISFEPSPREQRALSLNLRLNRCKNVIVEGLALSDENGESDLYVLEDRASGCNSLKPPDVSAHMSHQRVKVARLDQCLANLGVDQVDFIKLDVEGGELAALQGAGELLTRRPRPVILAEVQDVRTQPWGYRARDILAYLSDRGYRWFGLQKNGDLERLDLSPSYFEGNFVAWPEEALEGCGF